MGLLGTTEGIAIQIGRYLIYGVLVYILTRFMNIRDIGKKTGDECDRALWALGAVTAGFLILGVILFLFHEPGAGSTDKRAYTINDIFQLILLTVLVYSPVIVTIQRKGETPKSIGITKVNLWPALFVGTLVIALFVLEDITEVWGLSNLGYEHRILGVVYYAIIGFSEEIVFRGYLQTRLVAWMGTWKGWILASFMMALAHFWQRIFTMHFTPVTAIIDISSLLLPSLFLGFVMLRTKNVVASGLIHTFMDSITLFI